MSFNYKQQISKNLAQVTQIDIAQDIIFTPPIGRPVTVKGWGSKHFLAVNEIGFISVTTKKATVTIMESVLLAAGYTTRDLNGNLLTFAKHLITYTDVSGQTMTYIVQDGESRRNEDLGMLSFTLGYFATGTPPRTIYGWKDYKIYADVVATVDPFAEQVIGNGDTIPLQYALNSDGTLTIPYLISIPGIQVLTPFMVNNDPYADMPYNRSTGTFDATIPRRGFRIGNKILFNASLPIYTLS